MRIYTHMCMHACARTHTPSFVDYCKGYCSNHVYIAVQQISSTFFQSHQMVTLSGPLLQPLATTVIISSSLSQRTVDTSYQGYQVAFDVVAYDRISFSLKSE